MTKMLAHIQLSKFTGVCKYTGELSAQRIYNVSGIYSYILVFLSIFFSFFHSQTPLLQR